MSFEGQGHFFTIYFPDYVCFVLYSSKISGERLKNHWSPGYACIYASTLIVSFFQIHCQNIGLLLAHLSRGLKGELIVYQSSRRLCVCLCVAVCVCVCKHFQT